MRRLVLVRGIIGSGKTTLALLLAQCREDAVEVCADYFMVNEAGVYEFSPDRLPEVHGKCEDVVREAISKSVSLIVVHNTFSERWEMERYIRMAAEGEYQLTVVDLFNAGKSVDELTERNVHGAPREAVRAMMERWQHDWRTKREKGYTPRNYRPKDD